MLFLNFSPFPTLHTERLILRQLGANDEAEIFALRSDDEVNKYLARTKASSKEDAAQFITKINNSIEKNEALYWGVTLKENPKLIGTVSLWNISREEDKAEIGYELLPEFQGKGIMQEAISKVIEYSFSVLKLQTIEAYTHPDNDKSSKLLERFHFNKTGVLEAKNEGEIEMMIYTLSNKKNTE